MNNTEDLSRFCKQLLEQGKTLAELTDVSLQELENVYSRGFGSYQQGHYSRALEDFSYLVIHNPWDRRFYIALGSTLQCMERYKEALSFFALALFMDSCDPAASYRIAECFIGLKEITSARDALQTAIQQSYSNPEHVDIRNMSIRLLSTL